MGMYSNTSAKRQHRNWFISFLGDNWKKIKGFNQVKITSTEKYNYLNWNFFTVKRKFEWKMENKDFFLQSCFSFDCCTALLYVPIVLDWSELKVVHSHPEVRHCLFDFNLLFSIFLKKRKRGIPKKHSNLQSVIASICSAISMGVAEDFFSFFQKLAVERKRKKINWNSKTLFSN